LADGIGEIPTKLMSIAATYGFPITAKYKKPEDPKDSVTTAWVATVLEGVQRAVISARVNAALDGYR
jgi:hypothetical protein